MFAVKNGLEKETTGKTFVPAKDIPLEMRSSHEYKSIVRQRFCMKLWEKVLRLWQIFDKPTATRTFYMESLLENPYVKR